MAGTIIVDRIESDASYASTINVAAQVTFSNTVSFSSTATLSGNVTTTGTIKSTGRGFLESYDYQVPTTGFSYTFGTYNVLILNPAGTLATGTITMPANPVDGMTVTFSSTQEITSLTLAGNGATINNTISGLVPGQSMSYIYRSASTSWFVFNTALTPTLLTTLANLGQYTVSYLAVAGGAGSSGGAGGGGAGGFLTGSTSVLSGTSYTITVGAGGSSQPAATGQGDNGANSVFGSIATALGGGGGSSGAGVAGGSGGGGRGGSGGGSGTVGQGSAGGSGGGGNACGGGGGAGAVGSNGSGSSGGPGGVGTASSLSGSSTTYAGGGGGAGSGGNGSGSTPGGGASWPNNGTANTGGGGGATWNAPNTGTNGGSGIVIISYAGSQKGTGGNVTTASGNTIHTFTTSSTFTA
jgi:hypothetical protein